MQVQINSYKHPKESNNFFDNISFNIEDNGIYFLIGSSGVGKTTLLNIMLGLNEGNFEGSVKFKKDTNEYTPVNVRKQGLVGYMSQDSTLIPWINVKENLLLPSKINRNLNVPTDDNIKTTLKSLNFDLDNADKDLLTKYSDELSFGMKARIGLARVLLYNPSFLILDELFTGTDSHTNKYIGDYLKQKENDMLIFSVSHNVERAFEIAKKIFVLHKQSSERKLQEFEKENFESEKTNIINLLKN